MAIRPFCKICYSEEQLSWIKFKETEKTDKIESRNYNTPIGWSGPYYTDRGAYFCEGHKAIGKYADLTMNEAIEKYKHQMKKYFYTDGTNNFGPFTIAELKEKGITRETMIWFQELGAWKRAGTIQELNDLFTSIASPIQQQNDQNLQTFRQNSPNNTIDILVFISIVYWFVCNLAGFIIQKLVDNWYDTPLRYFQIGINIIFAAVPVVFAISVRNKTLRIIAIILASLLSILILYNNIDWLIRVLNNPR